MSKHNDADRLIASYSAAYERRHGKIAPGLVYERGWYVFKNGSSARYRRHRIEGMRDFLLEQARQIESLARRTRGQPDK